MNIGVLIIMSIQDKINDMKIKVDKLLYEKGVFFIVTEHDADYFKFRTFAYFSAPNRRKCFGFIGYNLEENCVTFASEWKEMSERNRKEGLTEFEHFILLENEEEFSDYFAGVLLTEILNKRKGENI